MSGMAAKAVIPFLRVLCDCLFQVHGLLVGLRKESGDARASSFLKLLSVIPFMLQPPHILFVENVVGFEVCYASSTLM